MITESEPCEDCGSEDNVGFGPCPYAEEIHGIMDPVFLFDDCACQRAMDV